MSEFSSFYLQIHIEKKHLEKYLLEPSKNISDYDDWGKWFSLEQRISEDYNDFLINYSYRFSDSMKKRMEDMIEHVSYDNDKQLLIMDNINIGENFEIFMQYMIVFRGISAYAIPNSKENFMVIYPFWWGNREHVNDFANVFIEFVGGMSLLTDNFDKLNIELATKYFEKNNEDFAKEYYDKYGYF